MVLKHKSLIQSLFFGTTAVSLFSLIIIALHGLPTISNASAEGASSLVSVGVESALSIVLTPQNNLSIPITPTADGAYSSRKLTVDVATSNATGYKMVFGATGSDTNLTNTVATTNNTLLTTSGTITIPTSIDNNTWGYAVPKTQTNSTGLLPNDTSGFDNTYTEATSEGTYAEPYAATPAYTSPVTLKTTTANAASDKTDLFFGVKVDYDKPSGTYRGTVTFTATGNYVPLEESICRNADPFSDCQVDIDDNLIPIKYTGSDTNREWSKADVDIKGGWYDYSVDNSETDTKWANAVAVTSATLSSYKTASPNTVISEDDILAYYVYIPRYAYEVQRSSPTNYASCTTFGTDGNCSSNDQGVRFGIKFQKSTDAKLQPYGVIGDGTGTCERFIGHYSDCAGTNKRLWTHPAFTFGDTELNGIWIGKFETSSASIATTDNGTIYPYHMDAPITDPIVKPGVFARRNQSIVSQFASAQNALSYHNLTSASETRMMKNSDWGAIVYLAHSYHGNAYMSAYVANVCYSQYDSIISPRFVTSMGADTDGACYGENDISGIPPENLYDHFASVTSNIYGIYDMSGGSSESTLSNYSDGAKGSPGDSGLTPGISGSYFDRIDDKYFDIYPSTQFTNNDQFSNYDQCSLNTCGDQSLFETIQVRSVTYGGQSWFSWSSYFANSSQPWAERGGSLDFFWVAGLFAQVSTTGMGEEKTYGYGPNTAFRLVLSRY